jgi:DNA ligase-associated metallophosphoesterase
VADSLRLALAGEPVELLADRALFWPARRRLLIADLHLGKADSFRRAGLALPAGGTAHDLGRLTTLIDKTGAEALWVLGDLLHGATDTRHWREGWNAWRRQHASLDIAVAMGNHDRALATAGLELRLLGDVIEDGPFTFRHAPAPGNEGPGGLHVVCGHLHPKLALPGLPGQWPGFWLQARGHTVLPAFSHFTGGLTTRLLPGDRFAVCTHAQLVMVAASNTLK